MFENMQVNEEADYTNKVDSLKDTCLRHISKISEICCQEFIKGYWEEKPLKVGGAIVVTKSYHQDTRAVFCNATDFLVWLCYPFSDTDFQTYINKQETKDIRKEKDFEKKMEQYKEIFSQICIMFNRCGFFDAQTGRSERSR